MFKLIYKSRKSNDATKLYNIKEFTKAFDGKEGRPDAGMTAILSDGETKRFRFDRIEAMFRV